MAAAGESESGAQEPATAGELKARGNEAYQRGDVRAAVDLWNQAIRRLVEDLSPESPGPSPLSADFRDLERSIYLNLAQGYLKLGEPSQALRACHVVLQEHPQDVKARYRAAEACLALRELDKAKCWLEGLLEAEPTHGEAAKLLKRVKAAQHADASKQRELARRMCAGATGFSDGREVRASPQPPLAQLGHIDPATVSAGTDMADQAARAALERDARRAAGPQTPSPEVVDLDSFRAKVMARSGKYNAYMHRSRRQKEGAQRSLKLQWLRSGEDASKFDDFVSPLQEEVHGIEAQERLAASAVPTEDDDSPDGAREALPGVAIMEEMD